MAEQSPRPPEERFVDYQQSRFLQFGNKIHLEGDPETVEDFARTQHYLETITDHCIEFGPWWEKTSDDIVYELDYHNAWHQYEVEQERKAGEKVAEYREVNLHHLHALSKRSVLALEDSGWEVTFVYRIVRFFDKLIDDAVKAEEENQHMMTQSQERLAELPTQPIDITLISGDWLE